MPNRISQCLASHEAARKKMFIPYLTPEFPCKGATVPLMLTLQRCGASLIELGMPHSDPLADGAVIQAASLVSIANGVTLQKILSLLREARTAGVDVPIVLMGYVNPLLRFGLAAFIKAAAEAGADGFIIPDLPPEEALPFKAMCDEYGMSNIFLISPVSSDDRIKRINILSTDFSYCIRANGVTGSRSDADDTKIFLSRVKRNTTKPFVVGFGISTREQAAAVLDDASGFVVGSALLKAIADAKTPDAANAKLETFLNVLLPN
jgi:tryptophan synthase alpha chain